MNFITKYLAWLQKGNPTGKVESYPEIDSNGETSVKGIFVIGDLTGIPLSYRKRIGKSKVTGTFTGTIKASTKILYLIFSSLFSK